MKHILLFGAGKSATYLIEYLKDLATACNYQVTIADSNPGLVQAKAGNHPLVTAAVANVEDEAQRQALIAPATVVISLLPPHLHYLVAVDCLAAGKHLLTASYTDEKIKALEKDIENKGLLFLCEMGLDPGIDHLSSMQLTDRIKALGGKITSFKSHCGGLVSPESDDNPWHYKVSWNPRNVILAGKAGAVYKEDGVEKQVGYDDIFTSGKLVSVGNEMMFSYYPNRDSISYMPLYKLERVATFIRTTLRHPDFCFGWNNIVHLKLTDDNTIYDTDGLTIADFFKEHLTGFGFNDWLNDMLLTRLSFAKELIQNLTKLADAENDLESSGETPEEQIVLVNEAGELDTLQIEEVKERAAASLAIKMHEASLILKQLFFLGLDDDEVLNHGKCTAAEVLQFIIEKKLALQPADKDMVVMLHEIEYELNNTTSRVKSSLMVKGENSTNTAMAKTVGLPLGIAAKLILEGTLTLTGLHIPTHRDIYNPVLPELEKHDIVFVETIEECS